jgi:hypothetical protein
MIRERMKIGIRAYRVIFPDIRLSVYYPPIWIEWKY